MTGEYDDLVYVHKQTKVFKSEEDKDIWCAEWEKTRKELISKFGKRLEEIYLVKEEKAQ